MQKSIPYFFRIGELSAGWVWEKEGKNNFWFEHWFKKMHCVHLKQTVSSKAGTGSPDLSGMRSMIYTVNTLVYREGWVKVAIIAENGNYPAGSNYRVWSDAPLFTSGRSDTKLIMTRNHPHQTDVGRGANPGNVGKKFPYSPDRVAEEVCKRGDRLESNHQQGCFDWGDVETDQVVAGICNAVRTCFSSAWLYENILRLWLLTCWLWKNIKKRYRDQITHDESGEQYNSEQGIVWKSPGDQQGQNNTNEPGWLVAQL